MAFSRRKGAGSDSTKRSRRGRGASRDPFEHLSEERAKAEEGEPWFLAEDDDALDLNVQAGISSNLRPEDLALLQEREGSGPPTTPREAVRPDHPPLDPSSGAEPGVGPAPPGLPLPNPEPGQGAASVFPVTEPGVPDPSPPPEPPPTTSAFDARPRGSAGLGMFEDSSLHTPEHVERSPGDTLAPPVDALRALEPAELEPKELEPAEVELEEQDSHPAPLAPEAEKIDPADVVVEPMDGQSGSMEGGEADELTDPDITPTYAEPIVANSLDDLRVVPEVSVPEPAAMDLFDDAEPDLATPLTEDEPVTSRVFDLPEPGEAPVPEVAAPVTEAPAPAADPRDEEPLRSALLQSFKDVVARAPAAPDDGAGEALGVQADSAEKPEPEEFRPRKPPSRPRRF